MSRLSDAAAEEVDADAVGDRGDDFAAVSAGVYVAAQRLSAMRHRDQSRDGFSDLGPIGVRQDERRQTLARSSIRGR
ncbi:hypothetical protein [Streptomyces sp. AS02]|uniref:hypothetical protein n=1 Tax=Streptomyces sp. AS02 TaxID=2938946 RepID=UPI0020219443|nr:hypothetical protein [Streptomyces sp. AS02]MCL8013989.1 hypothetical protein [Streptomyces sp. AS02]